jgi:hypothetical protein
MSASLEQLRKANHQTRETVSAVFDSLMQKLLRTPTDEEFCRVLINQRIIATAEEYPLLHASCSGGVELHTVNDKILIGAARSVARVLNTQQITYRQVSDFCYEHYGICIPPIALRTLMQPYLRRLESQSGITISKEVYADAYAGSELRSAIRTIHKRKVKELRGEGLSRDPFLHEVQEHLRACSIVPGENRLRHEIQMLQKTEALPLRLSAAISRDLLERAWWKISKQGRLEVTTRELSADTQLSVNAIQKLILEINRERTVKSLSVITIDSTPESKLDRSLLQRAYYELCEERGMPPTGGELHQRYARIEGGVDVGVRQVIKTVERMTERGFSLPLRGKSSLPEKVLEQALYSLHSHLVCAPTMTQLKQTLALYVPDLEISADGIKARLHLLRKNGSNPLTCSIRSGEAPEIYSPTMFFTPIVNIPRNVFDATRDALRQEFILGDPIYANALEHARALVALQGEGRGALPLLTRLARTRDKAGAYLFRSRELRVLLLLAANHGLSCIQKHDCSAAEYFSKVIQALTTSPGASLWQTDPRFYLTPLLSRWGVKMKNEGQDLLATPLGVVETALSFLVFSSWGIRSEQFTDPKYLAALFYGDAKKGERTLGALEFPSKSLTEDPLGVVNELAVDT